MTNLLGSLSARFLALYVITFFLIAGIGGVNQYRAQRAEADALLIGSGENLVQTFEDLLAEHPELRRPGQLTSALKRTVQKIPDVAALQISDPSGRSIAEAAAYHVGTMPADPMMTEVVREGIPRRREIRHSDGRRMIRLYDVLNGPYDPARRSDVAGAIMIEMEASPVDASIRRFMRRRFLVDGLLLLLAGIAIYWLTNRIVITPMRKLSRAAVHFGRTGEWRDIGYQGATEINMLASALSESADQRARRDRELRESEERFQLVARATSDIIWDWRIREKIVHVNDAFARAIGSPKPIAALPIEIWESYAHPDDLARMRTDLGEIMRSGGSIWSDEIRVRKADSSWFVGLTRGVITRDKEGRPTRMVGAMQDISERARAAHAERRAREAAEASNRAKSDFLANMSHEIRTPMNGVMGMIDLTLDTPLSYEQRDNLEIARRSAESLMSVINDILDFSRIEAGHLALDPVPFPVRETLDDIAASLSARAHAKGLELALDIAPDVPDVLVGDAGRLRQILVNLAGNAIKFTREGEVVIGVGIEQPGSGDNGVDVTLHFVVRDTGIGIPADKHAAIFESFTQADTSTTREYGGTGLGLAISTRLVALMNGHIWVESVPGQGSTFHFTSVFGRTDQPPATPAHESHVELKGRRVLVVDDNATNRRVLQQMLVAWEMLPVGVDSGAAAFEAIDRALAADTPYELMLLDAQMTEMSGFDVADQIRRDPRLSDLKVIMASSANRKPDTERATALGIAMYLVKPIRRKQLLSALARILGGATGEVPAADSVIEAASARDQPEPGALRILLAEDNAVNRKLAVTILEKRGHTVRSVITGLEAVDAWSTGRFDLIFMDVQMPEMDGLEATAEIRQRERASGRAPVPIIALTARAMKGDRERCLAAGMDGYVSKPLRASDLVESIATAFGGRAPAVSATEDAPANGAPIDREKLFALVGGDHALLLELIDLFADEAPASVDVIRASIADGDAGRLYRAAHQLKGSAASLTAARTAEAAMQLERMGFNEDLSGAGEAFIVLEREFNRLLAAFEELRAVVSV